MSKPDLGKMLTLYGRKPVLEALQDPNLQLFRLHLADSNRQEGIVIEIQRLAKQRQVETRVHSKHELSRISKNSQQDQGVALDIYLTGFRRAEDFLEDCPANFQIIAVDGITNPQNLGMIIRSVCASGINALLLPEKGCARLDALVIKASAGTLFKCPIIRCQDLTSTLKDFASRGTEICLMDSHSQKSLFNYRPERSVIYVLGNETDGVSASVRQTATDTLGIPLRNEVESLNVAVTAALIAFNTEKIFR